MLGKLTIKAKDFICIYFRCRSAQGLFACFQRRVHTPTLYQEPAAPTLEPPAGQGRQWSLKHLQMGTQQRHTPLIIQGCLRAAANSIDRQKASPKPSSFKQSGVWLSIKQFEKGLLFICFGSCRFLLLIAPDGIQLQSPVEQSVCSVCLLPALPPLPCVLGVWPPGETLADRSCLLALPAIPKLSGGNQLPPLPLTWGVWQIVAASPNSRPFQKMPISTWRRITARG